MEREEEVQFKKVGRGSFRFHGRIIKPGQTFTAKPSEISKTLRNIITPLSKIKETPAEDVVVTKVLFKKVKREGTQWWDILNEDGKKVNEKGLTEIKADELLTKMND